MNGERQQDNYKDNKLGNTLAMAIFIVVAGIIGFFSANVVSDYENEYGLAGLLISIGFLMLVFVAVAFIHIIVHEAGHLVFGLLSGYKFVSFRIGTVMLIRDNDKLKVKRFNIVGTGGQCLMMPDSKWNAYNYPYVLYNLGGSLANLVFALLSLGLYLTFPGVRNLSEVLFISFIVGLIIALINAIPMKVGGISNDGHNALNLKKDKEARRALYMQLYINGLQTKGVRLKDMPEEYFELPDNADLNNPLIVSIGVFKCNRLHDKKDFNKAKEYSKYLIDNAPGLLGIHKNELLCEMLFYEIIGLCRKDEIEKIYTKELQEYIKNTSVYVSRSRLMYAFEIFVNNDEISAIKELKQFNKIANNFPFTGDVESEREIIEFIDNLAVVKNVYSNVL